MREIKFRAWLYPYKRMAYEFNLFQKKGCFHLWLPGEEYSPDAFELMAYTGLKDKNGKEIYEGDTARTLGLMDNIVGTVQWSARAGWLIRPSDWAADLGYSLYEVRAFVEVIGNIYENPELLEAK